MLPLAPSTTKLLALLKLPMKVTSSTVTLFSCIETYARPSPNCTDSVGHLPYTNAFQQQLIPRQETADRRFDRQCTRFDDFAERVVPIGDKFDSLAAADPDVSVKHQRCHAVDVDIAAAGDAKIAGEGGVGSGAAWEVPLDDRQDAVVLEKLHAVGGDSGIAEQRPADASVNIFWGEGSGVVDVDDALIGQG